ncbi:MAG: hypothetical protein AAB786_01445 [Patescibacteria group bacterium]
MVFVLVVFVLKNKDSLGLAGKENGTEEMGLIYGNEILENLITRDTDLDGVLDWEEGLWGTDPTKKDTNDDGVFDGVEIAKLKTAQEDYIFDGELGGDTSETGELTETDKFSREFFSTVTTLNQSGVIDQATMDKLGESLAEKIKNSAPRKIFLLSDLKIIEDGSLQAIKNYNNALDNIRKKYPVETNAMDILQKFIVDENTVDVAVLSELDPIIEQTEKIVNELAKMSIPESIAPLHLDFLNGIERLVENLNDIQLYEVDVILALSAISQYEENITTLESANNELVKILQQKLSN